MISSLGITLPASFLFEHASHEIVLGHHNEAAPFFQGPPAPYYMPFSTSYLPARGSPRAASAGAGEGPPSDPP